jgi:hypothetical protein
MPVAPAAASRKLLDACQHELVELKSASYVTQPHSVVVHRNPVSTSFAHEMHSLGPREVREPDFPFPGTFITSVKESCRAATIAANIKVSL